MHFNWSSTPDLEGALKAAEAMGLRMFKAMGVSGFEHIIMIFIRLCELVVWVIQGQDQGNCQS